MNYLINSQLFVQSYFQFLELYNPGTTDIDMSGYSFSQGVNHVFADGTTLAAGAYMIVSIRSYLSTYNIDPETGDTLGFNVNGNITENVHFLLPSPQTPETHALLPSRTHRILI